MIRNARQGLATGAATVTIAITGAAFWLSYEHLHDVADSNGLPGIRAWAWPSVIDLFIIAGELLILRASLRGRFDWFAYLLAGTGSLGSIALNVAGVGPDAAVMEYVVAAVPPVAALLAFAAVMRQVHEALAKGTQIVGTPGGDHVAGTRKVMVRPYPTLVPAGARLLPLVPVLDHSTDVHKVIKEPRPEVVPEGARLLPLVLGEMTTEVTLERVEPEPEQAVTRPAIETGWRAIDWSRLDVTAQAEATAGMATAVRADEARQVVTVPVTITPAELRKRARKLNREAVNDTGRPVTIAGLMDELNLSRRDATALRREVVEGKRS